MAQKRMAQKRIYRLARSAFEVTERAGRTPPRSDRTSYE
jgi:hypothetical protein